MTRCIQEERSRRIKHWAGFPSQAIAYCLREAGLGLGDVHCVAINRNNRALLSCGVAALFLRLGIRQFRAMERNFADMV